jgi:hypothetical protein
MAKTLAWTQIMSAKSALNEAASLGPVVAKAGRVKLFIVFGPGTSAGAVQLEEAHSESFAGAWAALGAPLAWAAANSVKTIVLTEASQALKIRISTAIVGGTVDVWALVTD